MTTKHNFDIEKILNSAWDKTKEHFLFLVILLLGSAMITKIAMIIPIIGFVVAIFISMAIIKVSLIIISGKKPTVENIKTSLMNYNLAWKLIIGTLIYIAVPFLTIISLIITTFITLNPTNFSDLAVPFFILTLILAAISAYIIVVFQFYKFTIVDDENAKIIDSFKKSMNMVNGNFWSIVVFMVILVIMNALGKYALGIGLIITIPISLLASTILYKELSSGQNKESTKTEKADKKAK